MSLIDVLSQTVTLVSGAVGTAGGGVSGYMLKRYQSTERRAAEARVAALMLQRQVTELRSRVDDLYDELAAERLRTNELHNDVSDHVKEGFRQWNEMQRIMERIAGKLEVLWELKISKQ